MASTSMLSPLFMLESRYFLRMASSFDVMTASKRYISRRRSRQLANIPENAPSASQLASRIRKRLDRKEKEDEIDGGNRVVVEDDVFQLGSLAAERFYQSNRAKFAEITSVREKIEKERWHRLNDGFDSVGGVNEISLPLKGQQITTKEDVADSDVNESEDEPSIRFNDRGFYVQGDQFTDEYTAATVFDFPEDEMSERYEGVLQYGGAEDAVEAIEFQEPGQSLNPKDQARDLDYLGDVENSRADWMEQYGSVDARMPTSNKACAGCGAKFHCKDASLPGFLPVELFTKLEKRNYTCSSEESLCRRCYLLKRYNFLLNVNVCEVDYRTMMSHLKLKQEALIVLVVDMSDLPGSVYRHLPDIIGEHKPMIVVGNKVDLLPPDIRSGYLKHFRDTLYDAIDTVGFTRRFNVLHTALLSAKTGFGVEELITNIHLKWSTRGSAVKNDLYLVGCTNAGKSTLFNALLQSDLCKVRAIDLVERATTSIWPGTTISLLKFPVMNPTPHKLELRRRRLLASQAWLLRERRLRKQLLEETGDSKYATLQAHVGNTFKETEEELQPISVLDLRKEDTQLESTSNEQKDTRKRVWNPDDDVFAKGNWCYDTPGTVNEQQIVNILTLDELIAALPRKMMLPRTVIVYEGDTLLIGGIARVDLTEVSTWSGRRTPVYMSVFASDALPVNVMKTDEVDAFLERYLGSAALVVPQGNADRMAQFPKLESDGVIKLTSFGREQGTADVIVSSIGWVCMTSDQAEIKLNAYTPAARGIAIRQPPILPFCAKLKGSRIAGTAQYRVRPIKFPVNQRRLRRENGGGAKPWRN